MSKLQLSRELGAGILQELDDSRLVIHLVATVPLNPEEMKGLVTTEEVLPQEEDR